VPLKSWEDEAAAVLNDCPRGLGVSTLYQDRLHEIEGGLDQIKSRFPNFGEEDVWAFQYIVDDALQGAYPNSTDSERDVQEADLLRLIASKQHDYGHGNILWAGVEGVIIRMHDKVERIKNLQKRHEPNMDGWTSHPVNEALLDSWLDLAGYAIIAIMLIEGTFEAELAPKWEWKHQTVTVPLPPNAMLEETVPDEPPAPSVVTGYALFVYDDHSVRVVPASVEVTE
jgi:hypothetical protein